MYRVWTLVIASIFMYASAVGATVTPDIITRGWKPQVEMSGAGDPDVAVANLREVAELQRVVLRNTEFHQQTQQFIDELWASLKFFNLGRYYSMLPEADGDWRQLKVYGARNGKLYQVGPIAEQVGIGQDGATRSMGDMSALIRAKKLQSDGDTHYLLHNTLELGLGQLRWPSVQQAAAETLRIVVAGSPGFDSREQADAAQVYRDKVIHMNPTLGSEDVDVIAPLWAAFPAMWEMLAQLGRVEDVVYHDDTQGFRQLKATFAIDPLLMQQHYPAISKHIVNIDRLLHGSFELSDARGQLLAGNIDSRTLRANIEMFVANGRIVPVQGGKVMLDAPPIPANTPWDFNLTMNGMASIWGVVAHMQNIKARVHYLSTAEDVKVVAQVMEVPDISIKGNALGIMPTAVINAVLPLNMDDIMREFMAVACRGNDGKGILIGAHFRQSSENETAKLVIKSAFEGLDNFFVRVGMGIVSDRVIPDDRVSEELRRFVYDMQDAFVNDLEGFARIAELSQIEPEIKKAL